MIKDNRVYFDEVLFLCIWGYYFYKIVNNILNYNIEIVDFKIYNFSVYVLKILLYVYV